MDPTPGSNGNDCREYHVLPVPAPATFNYPVVLDQAVCFEHPNVQVRTDRDMNFAGSVRVLGNLRVAGSTTVQGLAILSQTPSKLEVWSPKSVTTTMKYTVYDQKVVWHADAYHFNEGLDCTTTGEIIIKGNLWVEGNLTAGHIIVCGTASFWGGLTGNAAVRPLLLRAGGRDIFEPQPGDEQIFFGH